MKTTTYIALGALGMVAVVALAGMYKFNYLAGQPGYDVDGNKITVTDFETCAAVTGVVAESYPRQCFYEGESYTEAVAGHDVIIGMSLAEAELYAEQNTVPFRVGMLDGEYMMLTMDYVPGRITAEVANAVVVGYTVE